MNDYETKYVVSQLRNSVVIDYLECLTYTQATQIRDEWAAKSSIFDSFLIQEVKI